MQSCYSCYIYRTWTSKEVSGFKVVIGSEAEGRRATLSKGRGERTRRGNFYEGVDPSSILSELPTYLSLFWGKKNSIMYTIEHPLLLKPHKHEAACEKPKFESVFSLWIFFNIINFLSIWKWQLNKKLLFLTRP